MFINHTQHILCDRLLSGN